MGNLRGVWSTRREGWLIGLGVAALISASEAATIWLVATDSVAGNVSVAAAVSTDQAVFAAGFLSQYFDPDWALEQAAVSVEKIQRLEHGVQVRRVDLCG